MTTASFSSLGSFPRTQNSSIFTKTFSSTLGQRQFVCMSVTEPSVDLSSSSDATESLDCRVVVDRRKVLLSSVGFLAASICNARKAAAEFADMPALRGKDYGKTKMSYPDYNETQSGLQYKDLRVGSGPTPKIGETVVVDWDGYTIGYYGRIFEARNKTKGGSFEGDDKDFFKFRVGSQEVIPAFEEAITGMALGGIRSYLMSSSALKNGS
ncbi:peptidyl-prolyl cis-trans isomerase FKBP19, chloroplastic isoform X2 [Lycium ferocissimum]|uniref:peptidyl-prolyl cis-trans isomerase FKBP19, chloroplastic isoform X2 n=1 Tax=Lycium ferocissimum TaxID=112874 RepID=UPI002814B9E0|nr:peptidyl-prolyl cis-trans isomerase FKBP19, chloroplastic isoform X2 [Lycium ferocissimum]